jgi:hypothetical protein
MKTGWKDMYFAKKVHSDKLAATTKRKFAERSNAAQHKNAYHKANANIGSDAEIAAYLARVPVAPRFELPPETEDEVE